MTPAVRRLIIGQAAGRSGRFLSVRWNEVRTLDDVKNLEPSLVDAMTGKSKDFFVPASTRVHWEVERKPYYTGVLVLRPNQPVSRAWDFVFRVVLSRIAPLGRGWGQYHIPPQAEPPFTGEPDLYIELPDSDRSETKKTVAAINSATAVANAVTGEAAAATDREHEELARELGLDRPKVGF
jgi:hypothetical protein